MTKKLSEKLALDKDTVLDDTLYELEDAVRLSNVSQIDRYYSETQSVQSDFIDDIREAMIPLRKGKKTRHPFDIEEFSLDDINDMDRLFLNRYIQVSNLEALNQARLNIRAKIEAVHSHPEYADAVRSYRNQHSSSNSRNRLYAFLEKNGYIHEKKITSETPLFHGLCISGGESEFDGNYDQELLAPNFYLDKLKSILAEGIQSSANSENLPSLESVFCVPDIKNAYGLLAVRFFISTEQRAWSLSGNIFNSSSEGYQLFVPAIQTPVIQKPFEVVIRSNKFINTTKGSATSDVFKNLTKEEHKEYLSQLVKLLKAENIPFKMVDPDGALREPRLSINKKISASNAAE